MDVVGAILLGLVEGITEFLPVSSTAHLIIAGEFLGWSGETAKTFEIFIQLGAILAVLWLYRARLRRFAALRWSPPERRLALGLCISFLPAAGAGALLHRQIKGHLFDPVVVAVALLAGGVAILAVERLARPEEGASLERLTPRQALGVGLAQCLSLVPGVSRAAATILGGLAMGLPRTAATEYSFLLAIPTMFAATLFELVTSASGLRAVDVPAFAAGFLFAMISALIVVRLFLRYVQSHRFTVFAWYRIALGGALLFFLLK